MSYKFIKFRNAQPWKIALEWNEILDSNVISLIAAFVNNSNNIFCSTWLVSLVILSQFRNTDLTLKIEAVI